MVSYCSIFKVVQFCGQLILLGVSNKKVQSSNSLFHCCNYRLKNNIYIYIYINKNYSLFLSSLLIVFFSIHFPLKVQEDLFLWKGFLLTFWSLFFGQGINFIIWIVGNLRKKLISRQLKNLIISDSSSRAQLESIQSK